LTFERRSDAVVDRETGSRWNVLGHAIDGPLAGSRLTQVDDGVFFAFAWLAFQPASEIRSKAGEYKPHRQSERSGQSRRALFARLDFRLELLTGLGIQWHLFRDAGLLDKFLEFGPQVGRCVPKQGLGLFRGEDTLLLGDIDRRTDAELGAGDATGHHAARPAQEHPDQPTEDEYQYKPQPFHYVVLLVSDPCAVSGSTPIFSPSTAAKGRSWSGAP
jgi:hypothetical protein